MPSLEQIHHERLAAAVERAQRSWLLRFFDVDRQAIETRVERWDGSIVMFKLKKVELDDVRVGLAVRQEGVAP